MEGSKGIGLAASAAALLCACVSYSTTTDRTPAPVDAAPAPAVCDDALAGVLRYAGRVRELPAAQQEAEYAERREAYLHAADPLTRLQLAALLSLPGVRFRDPERARLLLQAGANDASAIPPLRHLAALWLHELEHRTALERALAEERRDRQQLQRRLDQLKTIEEELHRRQTPPVVPAR